MRSILLSIIAFLCSAIAFAGDVSTAAFNLWHGNKYSMFIHFGLYSELGGVWNGQKIDYGYSEQIRAHGHISREDYAALAHSFNPDKFDADQIVALAKAAGMRSIVFTTKHHDGFCMWKTSTTDFNSWDSSSNGRDFVMELSQACRKGGLRFGLYFSLIDWNCPFGAPISDSNADPVSPEHHRYNMAQVEELLTGYGDISELWFDMGSLTPGQSNDLYALVHRLQPDCMVSGRLGNDRYDFCVMGDNAFPDGTLKTAWQTPASMFSETWGYRSWQQRGDAHLKAAEKLRALVGVVSHGGNYLLNIGPRGDGSVVEFERDVLLELGKWLSTNGEAIYGTEAFALAGDPSGVFSTRKGNNVYLIPSELDQETVISIPLHGAKLLGASYLGSDSKVRTSIKHGRLEVLVPKVSKDDMMDVICLGFDRPLEEEGPDVIQASGRSVVLSQMNAVEDNSYSCFDYYSNYQSVIGYNWKVSGIAARKVRLVYPDEYVGKEVILTIDGKQYRLRLSDHPVIEDEIVVTVSDPMYSIPKGSWSRGIPQREIPVGSDWKRSMPTGSDNSLVYVSRVFNADKECDRSVMIVTGSGAELLVNGRTVLKHLNPYGTSMRMESALVHLDKGDNQIVLAGYNVSDESQTVALDLYYPDSYNTMEVSLESVLKKKADHTVRLGLSYPQNEHSDIELSTLQIQLLSE